MTWNVEMALLLSGLIGLSLGLLGGGGSILAVPVLVYVARIAPAEAVAMSLLVVGATAVAASVAHARAGRVDLRVALWFGGAGTVAAFFGGRLTALVPGRVLLEAFAALMVLVGGWMLFGRRRRYDEEPRRARLGSAIAAGVAVGGVTGFLGVGGGFLIVPALVAFCGLDMRMAVGTSLVVIAINSAAGLLGHIGHGNMHLPLAAAFTAIAVAGAVFGERLARKLSAARLRSGFAGFVIAVGVAMVLRTTLGG